MDLETIMLTEISRESPDCTHVGYKTKSNKLKKTNKNQAHGYRKQHAGCQAEDKEGKGAKPSETEGDQTLGGGHATESTNVI